MDADGRLLLPIRAVLEPMGGTLLWDNGQKSASGAFGRHRFEIGVVSPGEIDGRAFAPKTSAQLAEGTLFVPSDFLQQLTNAAFRWDASSRKLTIRTVLAFPR
jgi:hypothetical protein